MMCCLTNQVAEHIAHLYDGGLLCDTNLSMNRTIMQGNCTTLVPLNKTLVFYAVVCLHTCSIY